LLLENLESRRDYQFEVLDATGRLLLQKEFQPTGKFFEDRLDVSALPQGWYGLVLKGDGVVLSSKGFSKVSQ
jgi:hypothetical protein